MRNSGWRIRQQVRWSPIAAVRFLCLTGPDLEEYLEHRAPLAKEVAGIIKPRLDAAALAQEYLCGG